MQEKDEGEECNHKEEEDAGTVEHGLFSNPKLRFIMSDMFQNPV